MEAAVETLNECFDIILGADSGGSLLKRMLCGALTSYPGDDEKYPSVVSLPGGCRSEVMTVGHPELSGCMLFVHWSVEVSRGGGVTPKINLLTKIPERALQLFPSQPVGGAAEAFQSLLRILGPEAALESVIRAVSPSPDT